MISWKAVVVGITSQVVLQGLLFVGIPLLGPDALLDWAALLTWGLGPIVGGVASGTVREGMAWLAGLLSGAVGTTVFVVAVSLRSDWWLVALAIVLCSLLGAGASLIGRLIRRAAP